MDRKVEVPCDLLSHQVMRPFQVQQASKYLNHIMSEYNFREGHDTMVEFHISKAYKIGDYVPVLSMYVKAPRANFCGVLRVEYDRVDIRRAPHGNLESHYRNVKSFWEC